MLEAVRHKLGQTALWVALLSLWPLASGRAQPAPPDEQAEQTGQPPPSTGEHEPATAREGSGREPAAMPVAGAQPSTPESQPASPVPGTQPAPPGISADTPASPVVPPAAGSSASIAASEHTAPDAQVAEPDAPAPMATPTSLAYRLERIDVRGNETRPSVILAFIPLSAGDTFDPNDPELGLARLNLLATGWFDDVRFNLERGSARGAVVLVIEVDERNTLLFERVIAGLSRVVTDTGARRSPVRPYAGLGLRESNLFGLGIGVAGAGVISYAPSSGQVLQYGVDFRYEDRSLFSSDYDFNARLFHNHAREFFGRRPLVVNDAKCPQADGDGEPPACDPDIAGQRAVVIYDRTGVGFGTGNHLTPNLHYTLNWLGERVSVLNQPAGASTLRDRDNESREPIDFRIEDNASVVSSVELGLVFDTRDHPATPSTGDYLSMRGRFAAGALGSDYDFARVEVEYRHHFLLPWEHLLQLGVFGGSVFGYAPFFYHYYAADLSALLPSRQLELNLDHRRTHNLLGTSILEMDQEELAARVEVEYQLPILRRGRGLRRLDAYLGVGLFMLSRREDLRVAIPNYEGFGRWPVDLTFDLGVVADTDFGLFKVGFSSLIGFLPDLGQETP